MIFSRRSKGGPLITGIKNEPFRCLKESSTAPVASIDRQNGVCVDLTEFQAVRQAHSTYYRKDETRSSLGWASLKQVAGSVTREDQIHTKRGRDDDILNPRYITSTGGELTSTLEKFWYCDLMEDELQPQAKRRKIDEIYDELCKSVEEDDEEVGFLWSELFSPGRLAKAGPRPLIAKPRLAEAEPKPLCMISLNVSMSEAKAGTFKGAQQPVFVYLAAKLKAKIRIRLQIVGMLWEEVEEQPFHDGKSITKGDLAMSIARKLENMLTSKKRASAGELVFVDLVQECWEIFRLTFKPALGGT